VKLKFETQGDVLRVEIRQRETAEETREAAQRSLEELEKLQLRSLLMVVKDSRAIFKVEEYGLSALLARASGIAGLRIALVTDDASLRSSHQYVSLIAGQRGVQLRVFPAESEALAWLREPR
jgi:hypothetical protein